MDDAVVQINGLFIVSHTMTEHEIPLICDELEFLCAKVDNPTVRFEELKDFIEMFQFVFCLGHHQKLPTFLFLIMASTSLQLQGSMPALLLLESLGISIIISVPTAEWSRLR